MNSFTISQLSRFSGIKPHTIRIWEQRYGALKPGRSEGNTRFYNGEQLRRLLNITGLLNANYKISEISGLSDDLLHELIYEQLTEHQTKSQEEFFISQLLASSIDFDPFYFDKIFNRCVESYGLFQTYKSVIYPLLVRIGLLWSCNKLTASQEHFITHLIKQKICAAIEELPSPPKQAKSWLLFLPEDEQHELGLLFASYILRHAKQQVIYLGANMPFNALESTATQVDVNYVLVFFTRQNAGEKINDYLIKLKKIFKGKKIIVSINKQIQIKAKVKEGLVLLQDFDDLNALL